AHVTEIGIRDLRIELEQDSILELDTLRISQPIIALALSTEQADPYPYSLLAQVQLVEELPRLSLNGSAPKVAIELRFPESLDRQQQNKIRQVLRSLE
ncbi:MAG TPA: cellulose synthase, partial [Allocoleopsis sp.]